MGRIPLKRLWYFFFGIIIVVGLSSLAYYFWWQPEPKKAGVTVRLYFINSEYMNTGNEQLERFLPVDRNVIPETGKTLPMVIMDELRNPPTDAFTALRQDLTLRSVRTEKETAMVDFAGKNLNGGSTEEILLIQQIVQTLTEIKGISRVQFLVDGEKAESLMGHVSIDQPFSTEDV